MKKIKSQANFGSFRIDSEQGVFDKNGIKLNLRPKELAVLWLLVRRTGELVTKEQIIDEVWKGLSTSDESIARCISVIKARLRIAQPGTEMFIKTEYGRGYRFVGEVSVALDRRIPKDNPKTIVKPTTVGEIANKDILTCTPEATVTEIACLLSQYQKSCVVVMHDQSPIGIWTEADALNLNLDDPDFLDLRMLELMRSPLITMEAWQPISEAVVLMRSKEIRHLVVVDNHHKAYGLVSQTDIVHCHGAESFMTVKNVKSIAYRAPLMITENLTVSVIVQYMRIKKTDILVINLPHRPLFAFTEHDVMHLLAKGNLHQRASDLMIEDLVTINQDTSILVARQLMDIKKIKHLAVLDEQGNFFKILSLADILADLEYSYVQLIEEILEYNHEIVSGNQEYNQLLTSAIHQTAGMILITDKYGDIKYVNESFEQISGYKFDEIKGLNPRFLSSGNIPKSAFRYMWETLLTGKTWKGELCNKKKCGELYWVLSSVTPVVNDQGEIHHFIAVEEDITDRKEVEIRLREIEQRFYEMVHHSPVMIWESDINGKVHFLNKYWLKFTGRNLHLQMGNGWAEQLHPDDLHDFLDAFQKALIRRSSFSLDHRLKNAHDEYRWVMNSGMPRFDENGHFLGFRGSCVDITERKMREIEAVTLAYHQGYAASTQTDN